MPTASPSAMSLPPSYHCHVCLQPPLLQCPCPHLTTVMYAYSLPFCSVPAPILPLSCRPTASPSAMSLPPSCHCHVCLQPLLLQCPCNHFTTVMYAYSLPFCNVPAPILPLSCMPTASPSAMSLPPSYNCHVCLQPPLLQCPCPHLTTVMYAYSLPFCNVPAPILPLSCMPTASPSAMSLPPSYHCHACLQPPLLQCPCPHLTTVMYAYSLPFCNVPAPILPLSCMPTASPSAMSLPPSYHCHVCLQSPLLQCPCTRSYHCYVGLQPPLLQCPCPHLTTVMYAYSLPFCNVPAPILPRSCMPTASPSAMSLPPSYHCHVCLQPPLLQCPCPHLTTVMYAYSLPFCNVPAPILPLSCMPTASPSAMSLHPILPLSCRPTASPSAMSLPPSYHCHVCLQPPLLQCPCPNLTTVLYAYSLPFCNVPAPILPLSCMPTASPSAMSLPPSYHCHVCLHPPLLQCPCPHLTTVMYAYSLPFCNVPAPILPLSCMPTASPSAMSLPPSYHCHVCLQPPLLQFPCPHLTTVMYAYSLPFCNVPAPILPLSCMPTASPSAMSLPPSYHGHVCLQPPLLQCPCPRLTTVMYAYSLPFCNVPAPILPLSCMPTASPSAMSLPPSYHCQVCLQPPLLQCPCPHLTTVMYAYSLPFCNVPDPILPLSCMPTASPSAMSLPPSYHCHVCLQPPLLQCPCPHLTTVV